MFEALAGELPGTRRLVKVLFLPLGLFVPMKHIQPPKYYGSVMHARGTAPQKYLGFMAATDLAAGVFCGHY